MAKSIDNISAISRLVVAAGERHMKSIERLIRIDRGEKICDVDFINCAARISVATEEIKEKLSLLEIL